MVWAPRRWVVAMPLPTDYPNRMLRKDISNTLTASRISSPRYIIAITLSLAVPSKGGHSRLACCTLRRDRVIMRGRYEQTCSSYGVRSGALPRGSASACVAILDRRAGLWQSFRVNPTACCNRHTCRESASGSRSGTDVRNVRGSEPRTGAEHAGAGCDSHSVPAAARQRIVAGGARLLTLSASTAFGFRFRISCRPTRRARPDEFQPCNRGQRLRAIANAFPPLKPSLIALYTLHSAYRI